MIGLFITGTDTGVGKTTITVGLIQLLRRQGWSVRVSKPVATGAGQIGGRWISEDTIALAQAAGQTNLDEITPWAFPEPVAPPVAARLNGRQLNLNAIASSVRGADRPASIMLVEGIGGLLCPLTEADTVAGLAKAVDLPLLIVARRKLGTLNHTLLTVEAAKSRGLRISGLIVNETEPCRDLAAATNVDELRRLIDVPLLAVVPHGRDVADALSSVDWRSLMS
jgi:dethiobiotin synthetase